MTNTPDEMYLKAADELESGNIFRAAWARALAEADGDHAKAQARYIRIRVGQLEIESSTHSTSANSVRGKTDLFGAPRKENEDPVFGVVWWAWGLWLCGIGYILHLVL